MVILLSVAQTVFILGALCAPTLAGQREVIVTAESFARAVAAATPGQTLVLTDGVYRDVKWSFSAKGRRDSPITLRAQTPGKVVVVGRSELTVAGEHLVVNGLVLDQAWGKRVVELSRAKHCRLTDCAFVACGNPSSTFSHVVYLVNGSAWNRVDHCYFEGSLSMSLGLRINEEDPSNPHNRFDHNLFKDIIRRSYNGQEAVQIGQGAFSVDKPGHALVEHNLFDNASGDSEIISNKSCCNIYRFNTFKNCRGSLTLRGGGSVLVHGNVFLKCDAALRVHAAHSFIVGNYVKGCNYGFLLHMGAGAALDSPGYMAPHHCVFANNQIVNCKNAAISIGGKPAMGDRPGYTVAPFANLFCNNVLVGNTGKLLRFDAANEQRWRATRVWAEGKAECGAQPPGVKVENVAALRAEQIAEFKADIAPILAGMMCPRSFEEACPVEMEVKVLEPRDVGPVWMQGDPSNVPRVGQRRPVPDLSKQKPKKQLAEPCAVFQKGI